MILRPTKKLTLDLFVDADFCSLHGREVSRNPDSARSHTGYIILLSDCPLLWKSQLQSHVLLSTLESEYSALSYALKTLLPLKRLLVHLMDDLNVDDDLYSRGTIQFVLDADASPIMYDGIDFEKSHLCGSTLFLL